MMNRKGTKDVIKEEKARTKIQTGTGVVADSELPITPGFESCPGLPGNEKDSFADSCWCDWHQHLQ